jgi:hypothetical protein
VGLDLPIKSPLSLRLALFTVEGYLQALVHEALSQALDADGSANTVAENAASGTSVGVTASASDPAGGTVTYVLTDDAGGRFQIDGNTGTVTVANGSLLSFEDATSHTITIAANDADGTQSSTSNQTISVTDVDEAPVATTDAATSVTAGGATLGGTAGTGGGPEATVKFEYYPTADGAGSATTVAADQSPVTSASGTSVSASVTGLSANTEYTAEVIATTDEGTTRGGPQTFTTGNTAPSFTQTTSSVSFAENGTGVAFDFDANDGDSGADDTSVTYSLGGPDADDFSIVADGELSFTSAPDFENPTDGDTNKEYVVDVTADDGESSNNTTTQTITVSVTDVNEAPVVATKRLTVNEGAGADLTQALLEATDPEQGPAALTYTIDTDASHGALVNTATATTLGAGDTFTQADVNNTRIQYQHDGSETTTDNVDVTVADGNGGSTSGTVIVSIAAQNDAPTISGSGLSDDTIEEDATFGPVRFSVGDAETAASSLTVTAASGDQTLVPDANITLGGSDDRDATTRTIEVRPAANTSGTATITVTVDDGAGTNNIARESFVLTVTAVPDLALRDAADLGFSGRVQPGTSNNLVGNAELSVSQAAADFRGITIANSNAGVEGITAARLFVSSDNDFDPKSYTKLGGDVAVDPSGAPATLTFFGPRQTLTAGTTVYIFLAVDVEAGAPAEDVLFSVAAPSDLTADGEIASVNGTATDTFSGLPLTSSATTLPVEFAGFDATADGRESVNLRWQTASETGNAGFRVQRRGEGGTKGRGDWVEVGSVDGAGTTTEIRSYAFTDEGVPYDADSLTYRLKQVDVDGSVSYSETRTVARRSVAQVQLLGTYPNPARSRATVRFAIPDGATQEVTLRLYDVLGRQVRTVRAGTEAGRHELQLDTGGLASGTYFLRLTAGGTTKTQQVTVVQ